MKYPNPEDSVFIRNYIMLPLIVTMLERDKKLLEQTLKTPGPYVRFMNDVIRLVDKELANTRKQLQNRGIRFYEENRDILGVWYRYTYCGYHHTVQYEWPYLRGVVGEMLLHFLVNQD